jgi:hypothetical protein
MLVASYEALRRIALGQRGPDEGPSLGLAILRRQGVAAWLRAWARCPRPSDRVAGPTRPLEIPPFVHTEQSVELRAKRETSKPITRPARPSGAESSISTSPNIQPPCGRPSR